ncbi:MAG: hypothetical protein U0R26_04460 [Solirubrobacterales bacterium]
MTRPIRFRTLVVLVALAGLFFLIQAPPTLASSGSITNVHANGGKVEATYTTNFDVCDGSYCGWFPHAWQYPASQSCQPNGSHFTYVGQVHGTSGSETATDYFYPAYTGPIRICLYGYQSGNNYFIAEAVFTPSSSISGSITNVHGIDSSRAVATYTTNFNMCTEGSCGWYPHAWQYPASRNCSPGGSHFTYVGDFHSEGGSETTTDDFYPDSGAVRICLYAYHHSTEYFIADAVYFHTPAPTLKYRVTVGDQYVWLYYPRSCVVAGRKIQLSVITKPNHKRGQRKTYVSRVVFSIDQSKKTDKQKKWQATFPTTAFAPNATHRSKAKITFRQRGTSKKLVRTLSKSFRICPAS